MRKYLISTLGFMLMLHSLCSAQFKINYGVGVDVFQAKLGNVDRENFTGYGHSMPGFQQNDQLGFGATFLATTPLYKNLSFETGVGISNFNSQFSFDYIYPINQRQMKETLRIHLYYLKVPLFLAYNFRLNQQSSIGLSGGANAKFLFAHNDNYEQIIWEFIGGQSGIRRYKRLLFSPQLNVGYSFKFKDNKSIRLEAMAGYDMDRFTNKERSWWGFYTNLSTASYSYYGLSLKYFFH